MGKKRIGNLVTEVTTNTAKFKSGLADARKDAKSFSARVSKSMYKARRSAQKLEKQVIKNAKSFVSLKGALGGVLGGTALTVLTKNALDYADATAKQADKIGLSTDALQEYRFAADQTGVAQNTLDMSLQRFTRRLAEAVQGKGELKGILEQYDIAVVDANGHSREATAVLADLADVIQNTDNEAERLRIAFKAFDSEGAAMVNTLAKGRDGLQAYAEQARDLGLIIDEQLLRNAETANDKLSILSQVIKIKLTTAVVENAEEIGHLAEAMSDAIPKVVDITREVAKFFDLIGDSDDERLANVRREIEAIDQLLAKSDVAQAFQYSGGSTAAFYGLEDATRFEKGLYQSQAEAMQRKQELLLEEIDLTYKLVEAQVAVADVEKQKPKEEKLGNVFTSKSEKEAKQEKLRLDRLAASVISQTRTEQEKYNQEIAQLDELLEKGKITQEAYFRRQKQLNDDLTDSLKEQGEEAKDVAEIFADGLEDAFSRGIDSVEDWGDVALDILTKVLQQALITNNGFDAVGSGLSGAFNNVGSLGGSLLSNIGSAIGGALSFQGFFADGGNYVGNQAMIVGERGPELMLPRSSGTIIPNHMLGGGGDTKIEIVNNTSGRVDNARVERGNNGRDFKIILDQEIAEQINDRNSHTGAALNASTNSRYNLASR